MSILTDLRSAYQEMLADDQDWNVARVVLHDLLTDDTIRALLEVAEMSARNSVCVCGKVWRYENHRHADDCPLERLVKEADDE